MRINFLCLNILGLLILANSSVGQTEICELNNVNHINKLLLTQRNDNCGEWGGDTKEIVIFRPGYMGELYANLAYTIMLCPPEEDEIEELKLENIKLSNESQCLVYQAIDELVNIKLSTAMQIVHSGTRNTIFLSDSSLVLTDYPSFDWPTFTELFNSLTE